MASEAQMSSSIVIESKPSASGEVCHGIMARLEGSGFSAEDLFAVHLALEEAFINAIKHGNKMDPAKEVKIEYSVNRDKIEIFIADEGAGFNPDVVPDPRCGDNIYKPNGRGLLLMRSYMDVVEHNDKGNRVRMVRYRERPSLGADFRQKQA